MTIGVATLVAGRRRHLAGLLDGLCHQTRPPDATVVVRMDSEPVELPVGLAARVVDVPASAAGLPLAAARNAGVVALGTERLILLDVDCIPVPGFVAGYDAALSRVDGLVCGEVRYLPPAGSLRRGSAAWLASASRHPARPAPLPGELLRNDLHALAWTTSLALDRRTFDLVGGFDERFVGYGGEDTDFAERARLAGVGVWWTGDALALHQDHGSSGLPRQHLTAIVRNARLFHELHGWWPMRGWLDAFAAQGLIEFDADRGFVSATA